MRIKNEYVNNAIEHLNTKQLDSHKVEVYAVRVADEFLLTLYVDDKKTDVSEYFETKFSGVEEVLLLTIMNMLKEYISLSTVYKMMDEIEEKFMTDEEPF